MGLAFLGLLGFLALGAPGFFAAGNLRDLLVSNAPVLVAAVGMTLVILARHIDISIGSQFAIGGVAAGLLAKAGLPMPAVGVGAVLVGALLGALNGALVAGLGLPSIVVTLATMVLLRESLRWATEGVWVQDLPSGFQWFGLGQGWGRVAVVIAGLAVFAAFAWGLRYLAGGRAVYATGSEPEAARLVGIRPRRVVFAVFVAMGALTGLAALLTTIQFIDVQTNAGVGLEMKVIAAVVVGGTAISGGRGTLLGTLLGVTLLGVIGPALTFLGTEAHWERALQGLVILLAVAADALETPETPCGSLTPPGRGRRGASCARASSGTRGCSPSSCSGRSLYFAARRTNFLTVGNAFEVVRASVEIGLLALALTGVILTGGIDLSVGSLLGLSAVLMGWAGREQGLPMAAAALVALGAGLLGGGLNALLVGAPGHPAPHRHPGDASRSSAASPRAGRAGCATTRTSRRASCSWGRAVSREACPPSSRSLRQPRSSSGCCLHRTGVGRGLRRDRLLAGGGASCRASRSCAGSCSSTC